MPSALIAAEWRNEAQRIKYPFADSASLTNSDGVTLDRDLFDDARIYPIGGTAGLFLRRIEVTDGALTFHVADLVNGELASGGFSFDVAAPDDVPLFDSLGRPAGILVSSSARLAALPAAYGEGNTLFESSQTEFAASVAVPLPAVGVRGVLLDDGSILTGDIFLVGTDGVVLSVEDGNIRIDVVGDPYALLKACEGEGFELPPFCGLRTINGIPPDSKGDFKLVIGGNLAEDNVLRIEQDDDGSVRLKTVGGLSFGG